MGKIVNYLSTCELDVYAPLMLVDLCEISSSKILEFIGLACA